MTSKGTTIAQFAMQLTALLGQRVEEQTGIRGYFGLDLELGADQDPVLRRSASPDGFPHSYRVAYRAEARHLVVEYQLPSREVIPTQARFHYNKSLDLVESKPRPPKETAKLYESVVSQIALRTLRESFAVEADGLVNTVIFNGHVSTSTPWYPPPLRP